MKLPESPKAALIDLAGVLHVGDTAIPGAVEALKRLRASGMPMRFLTNTTRSPRRSILAMLEGLGFEIGAGEIRTAVLATEQYVRARWQSPHYLVHPDIRSELGGTAVRPDVVVLGDAADAFTFQRLNEAFRLVMAGLPLVAMAKNRYFKEEDGLTIDMGAYVTALEFATGAQATVVGKPAAAFFLGALEELGVAPADAVLIGDDLRDDIGGAQACGIPGILVRTGKYRPADENEPDIRPAWITDDFASAVNLLLQGTGAP